MEAANEQLARVEQIKQLHAPGRRMAPRRRRADTHDEAEAKADPREVRGRDRGAVRLATAAPATSTSSRHARGAAARRRSHETSSPGPRLERRATLSGARPSARPRRRGSHHATAPSGRRLRAVAVLRLWLEASAPRLPERDDQQAARRRRGRAGWRTLRPRASPEVDAAAQLGLESSDPSPSRTYGCPRQPVRTTGMRRYSSSAAGAAATRRPATDVARAPSASIAARARPTP